MPRMVWWDFLFPLAVLLLLYAITILVVSWLLLPPRVSASPYSETTNLGICHMERPAAEPRGGNRVYSGRRQAFFDRQPPLDHLGGCRFAYARPSV